MKVNAAFVITGLVSWMFLGFIGWYTNSDRYAGLLVKNAQNRLDQMAGLAREELGYGFRDAGDKLKEKDIILLAYHGDSIIYWNENQLEPEMVIGQSLSSFREFNGILYYFEKKAWDSLALLTGIPLRGISQNKPPVKSQAINLSSPDRKVSCLAFIERRLPLWLEWTACLLGLLGLTTLTAAVVRKSLSLVSTQRLITALLVFCGGVFVLRILSLILMDQVEITRIPFFDDSVKPSLLSPTLGDMIMNIGLLCLLIWFIRAHIRPSYFKRGQAISSFGIAVINYWMVYVTAYLMVHIFKQLVMGSGLSFDFEYIFYLDIQSLVALAGILILAIALFVLDLHLMRIIRHLGMSPLYRLSANLAGLAGILPLIYLLPSHLPLLMLLALAGYLTLLDLFVDHIRPHATWFLTWMVTGSILVSSLLYQFHIDKELQQRVALARQLKEEVLRVNPDKDHLDQALQNQLSRLQPASPYLALYTVRYQPYRLPSGFEPLGAGLFEYKEPGSDTHSVYVPLDPQAGFYLTKKSNQLFKAFSFFSYIFILFNLILLVFHLFNQRMRWFILPVFSFFPSRFTLRYRIQLSMLGMSLGSFILIAIVIIFYLRRTSEGLALPGSVISYQSLQHEISRALNTNMAFNPQIKIYNPAGRQINSAVPERMPYPEYEAIQALDRLPYHTNSYHGYTKITLDGKSYFLGKNKTYTETNTKRRLNDILGTLLNVYVFLLILIVLISIVVANSITRPLTILSDKLKQIQIGGSNQKLEWNHDDELGGLIRNYNEMIQELDRSTRMLALTERETAWREMAKQVAHEIKNPLTPMKLITQHLQNSMSRAGQEEIPNLVKRVTQTLIEQIENLSKIASEFSNFAKLPAPENEKLVMNEVVTSTHDLFRKREDMDIHLRVPIDEIYIFADKNHVIRVLTNLIKNAIQAIPVGRRGKIEIVLYKQDEKAIVQVTDNGCGIPESMKDKVFYPNFTTKNSGTGLGLAIVRDIVDCCNGAIYFTTAENKGTSFYVEFPLMHMEDNFKVVERVSL